MVDAVTFAQFRATTLAIPVGFLLSQQDVTVAVAPLSGARRFWAHPVSPLQGYHDFGIFAGQFHAAQAAPLTIDSSGAYILEDSITPIELVQKFLAESVLEEGDVRITYAIIWAT